MNTKHTPGPYRKSDPNYNCDCEAMGGLILFCPLHKAAPEMLEALRTLVNTLPENRLAYIAALAKAGAAIAKAKGEK